MGEEKDPRTHAIIGAAMEVHREIGPGLHEPVYQEAFEYELQERGIPYGREVELTLHYKTRLMKQKYRADFICFEDVVVELKALDCLGSAENAQMINYLKVSKKRVGLLLNFGGDRLEFRRFVN